MYIFVEVLSFILLPFITSDKVFVKIFSHGLRMHTTNDFKIYIIFVTMSTKCTFEESFTGNMTV